MVTVNFTSMQNFDIAYNDVVSFANVIAQKKMFNSNILKSMNLNVKNDAEQTFFDVNLTLKECMHYDYLFFNEDNGITQYYFITNKIYLTETMTRLIIKLDVWQTYQFYVNYYPSFVERCHVDRWNGEVPTYNMVDEGLELGEYVQTENPKEITTLKNSMVMVASVPLGRLDIPTSGGGGNSPSQPSQPSDVSIGTGTKPSNDTLWQEGKLSRAGFRFLKGEEGIETRGHDDGYGTYTIGYGIIASDGHYFTDLQAHVPLNEA